MGWLVLILNVEPLVLLPIFPESSQLSLSSSKGDLHTIQILPQHSGCPLETTADEHS